MDYKQKYEEALERAASLKRNTDKIRALDVSRYVEQIFPELTDSEDERVRKELIRDIDIAMPIETAQRYIAWLEKQGNQKPINKVEPEPYFYCKYAGTTPLCSDCKRNHINSPFKTEEITTWYVPTKGTKHCTNYIDWSEKQGEQKSTDKVEPKFKVGNWCIDDEDGTIFQIVKVLDNTYKYKTNEGNEYSCTHYSLENDAKLWTIQDAKDGDVLANEDGIPFIFNGFLEKITVGAHCGITGGIFCIPREKNIWATRNVLPATKEQCDLLFQKMHEAGYEWDAEKKELKKIEQKPDFCHHEVDFSNCSEEYRKAYYDGWNNCNQQHAQLEAEQKPAWSEEDEETLNNILNDLKQDVIPDDEDIQWLKSIKKRMKGE